MKLTFEISDDAANHILELADAPAIRAPHTRPPEQRLHDVLEYAIYSFADGVRRPGSWERQVLVQLFGDWIPEAEFDRGAR